MLQHFVFLQLSSAKASPVLTVEFLLLCMLIIVYIRSLYNVKWNVYKDDYLFTLRRCQ
jgi:hypothetical protein